jgi:hypothetical protein
MFIIKSEFSKKPKLRGKSLVDLFGLSTRKSSLENLELFTTQVKPIIQSGELGGKVVNFPNLTSYFHPIHLREVYEYLRYLITDCAVTIDFSVYDSTLIDLVGESILRGSVPTELVRIQFELADGGRRELRFDEQGRIANWPVGYFEPSAPFDLGL